MYGGQDLRESTDADRRSLMGGFTGKEFLLGIQHLDAASRELFETHGTKSDGRRHLVEHVVDEAMVRMVGNELHADPYGIDRDR